MSDNPYQDFLSKDFAYAVVGATQNKDKWGYKIFKKLLKNGFTVYPVNPKYDEIEGFVCFPNLVSLSNVPDVVDTVVPPEVTEKVVEKCLELGVKKVWMQPGSESEKAIKFCEDKGIAVVHHACIVRDGLKQTFDDV